MTDAERPVFEYKIGLLAPSQVGKSTLIASLLSEGQRMLTGDTTVQLVAADRLTRNRIAIADNLVAGALKARVFQPKLMPGTSDPAWFRLLLEPRGRDLPIRFDILDYPGGWLENGGEGPEHEQKWNECEAFLADSSVLIVPIDSVLLMEAGAEHAPVLTSHLAVFQIKQVVLRWAKNRRERAGEPAMVIFCPVKCETYLSDSGSLQDHSAALKHQVVDQFSEVLETIREAAPHASVRYLPIDTYGCVELVSARWVPRSGAPGNVEMEPKYRVRPPGTITRKGLEDLISLLCRQLVDSARMQSEQSAARHQATARYSREYADLREGFFRDLWNRASGERGRRERVAEADQQRYTEAQEVTRSLFDVLAALAERRGGPRLHHLS
ncbi:hypothetical protein ACWC4D_12735 [Streptomyces sp. NPDC001288]|uniref:hypothetical protein n=1 Tax=unclassified Streptomyces TaxID=2593676 RepID=UPI00331799A6